MIRINKIPNSSKYVKEAKTFLRRHQFGCVSEVDDTGRTEVRNILDSLLKSSGFPSGQVQAARFCEKYRHSGRHEKQIMLEYIANNYHLDYERAKNAALSFISQNSSTEQRFKAGERLHSALIPRYADIFNGIAKLDCGMKYLVDFRADILDLQLDQSPFQQSDLHLLKAMSEHLKKVLSFAFNVGFLNLQRITWNSSCDMLQKVSSYEAVHPVRNWLDLKKRVGAYRRCYVYTHSSMPREPVVILHTALTHDIESSIASIVQQNISSENAVSTGFNDDSPHINEDPEKIGAAIFYSVTSTQKGLRGIELGNYLIKRVVGEILKEFPHVKKLSSLSPVPGFRAWLLVEMKKAQSDSSALHLAEITEEEKESICKAANVMSEKGFWSSMYHIISSNRWVDNSELACSLKDPLLRLCAHYLVNAKRRSYALNTVAHFHLRNGAVMWRLNWEADLSPRGLDNSCGIMVNYRYYMEETERNSQEYLETFSVKISENVAQILKPLSVSR